MLFAVCFVRCLLDPHSVSGFNPRYNFTLGSYYTDIATTNEQREYNYVPCNLTGLAIRPFLVNKVYGFCGYAVVQYEIGDNGVSVKAGNIETPGISFNPPF